MSRPRRSLSRAGSAVSQARIQCAVSGTEADEDSSPPHPCSGGTSVTCCARSPRAPPARSALRSCARSRAASRPRSSADVAYVAELTGGDPPTQRARTGLLARRRAAARGLRVRARRHAVRADRRARRDQLSDAAASHASRATGSSAATGSRATSRCRCAAPTASVVGYVCVLSRGRLDAGEEELAVLRIFAARAAAELERRRHEAALRGARGGGRRVAHAAAARRRRGAPPDRARPPRRRAAAARSCSASGSTSRCARAGHAGGRRAVHRSSARAGDARGRASCASCRAACIRPAWPRTGSRRRCARSA